MPVYLCKPGWQEVEPWRHGVQVYAQPFPMENERDGRPVRRVRHGEVVLVDEVSIRYSRYWLRLRWPGPSGGFAGYIALGTVVGSTSIQSSHGRSSRSRGGGMGGDVSVGGLLNTTTTTATAEVINNLLQQTASQRENRFEENDEGGGRDKESRKDVLGDIRDQDEPLLQRREETPDATPLELEEDGEQAPSVPPRCDSTGLYFPTSSAMELLSDYDDGLEDIGSGITSVGVSGGSTPTLLSLGGAGDGSGEPVFCRICREGLHEVEPTSAPPMNSNENMATSPIIEVTTTATVAAMPNNIERTMTTTTTTTTTSTMLSRFPSATCPDVASSPSPPTLTTIHPSAENPLLAPCACSGSIAFVHYLCVEQWRCRSRHPAARGGLNCETCGTAYTLPPPPVVSTPPEDHAMPPHVLAALRRPHFWWRVGAAVVRRKYLRSVVFVVVSPVVATYCRARRSLKKRGVSRRRWACSLCHRRARWKCVRCLRSYYCSRQCQNVSWHIIHKHVCYKPQRYWSSVGVYAVAIAIFYPSAFTRPIPHLLAALAVPYHFSNIGTAAGTAAHMAKAYLGADLRGRMLELAVVACTVVATLLSWGLVRAFFANDEGSSCFGLWSGAGDRAVVASEWLRGGLTRPIGMILAKVGFHTDPDAWWREGRCRDDLALILPLQLAYPILLVGVYFLQRAAAPGRPGGRHRRGRHDHAAAAARLIPVAAIHRHAHQQ